MKKIRILQKVIQQGPIYGKRGDVIEVPDSLAKEWIAAKYAEPMKETKGK